jgi:multidrug efflux pump
MSDVDSDQSENGVETLVTIDRDSASRIGVTPRAVDNALYNAFGQRQVATIYEDINQYAVIMEWEKAFAQGPEALNDVYVPSASSGAATTGATSTERRCDGRRRHDQRQSRPARRLDRQALNTSATPMVPLNTIASVSQNATPTSINHQNAELATTVSFNLPEGVSLSHAQAAIKQAEAEIGMPTSVRGSFQGSARSYSEQMKQQPLLIGAAIIAIYIVLGILYESYVHPVTVLSTLPAAGVGAVLALMMFGMEFSIIALIGVFLLLGIVKKNAILIIDFALTPSAAGACRPMTPCARPACCASAPS